MIKIAYLIPYISNSGPSNVMYNIISCLDKKRYNIAVITLFAQNEPDILERFTLQSIRIIKCSGKSRLKSFLGFNREIKEIFEREKFDIIHSHLFMADILNCRYNKLGKKITTVHCNFFNDYRTVYGQILGTIYSFCEMKSIKHMDMVVCCAESLLKAMKLEKLDESVCYIRNGLSNVKTSKEIGREVLGIPNDAIVYIYVGSLDKRKNILWLINEFVNEHKNNEYLLVLGSGYEEERCRAICDAHVKLLGFKNVPINYMNIADIYISASISEGFSMSIVEALECGLILLLSDIPAHKEIFEIDSRVDVGNLFKLNDIFSFKESMSVIREKISTVDREAIIEFKNLYLSAESMAEQYSICYDRLYREKQLG